MVPRTTHGLADHEAFDQRPVVVRAMRSDGEDVRSAADQQDFIVADAADELAAVGKLFLGDAVRQVGAAWS
jgi:hypothetical protein